MNEGWTDDCRELRATLAAVEAFVRSRDFYDLMQTYRHMPTVLQSNVQDAYEAVQEAIVKAAAPPQEGA